MLAAMNARGPLLLTILSLVVAGCGSDSSKEKPASSATSTATAPSGTGTDGPLSNEQLTTVGTAGTGIPGACLDPDGATTWNCRGTSTT